MYRKFKSSDLSNLVNEDMNVISNNIYKAITTATSTKMDNSAQFLANYNVFMLKNEKSQAKQKI